MKTKILIADIETFPVVMKSWEVYDTSYLKIERPTTISCFAAKWLNDPHTIVKGLIDYPGYKPATLTYIDDYKLVKELWDLLNEADIVVAHNGQAFDTKKIVTRFIVHHLGPTKPFKVIDTKLQAKRIAYFDSNKLNEIGAWVAGETKEKTGGYDLWEECEAGNPTAWAKMKKYNKKDVTLLEKVFLEMLPYMRQTPNLGIYEEKKVCPVCGSSNTKKDGFTRLKGGLYQVYKCLDRGCWSRDTKPIDDTKIELLQAI